MFVTPYKFDPSSYWTKSLNFDKTPPREYVDLFDQNGYDLTELEKMYSVVNETPYIPHRCHKFSIKKSWIVQEWKQEGAILNHSFLFERKGYAGKALLELNKWAKVDPIFYKIINIRPKWGLDFSMDYCGRDGETFEVLHYEYDGFSFDEIDQVRKYLEKKFLTIDWDEAAKEILRLKEEWINLDFFSQSDWKCNFFGIPKERFKMVTWK